MIELARTISWSLAGQDASGRRQTSAAPLALLEAAMTGFLCRGSTRRVSKLWIVIIRLLAITKVFICVLLEVSLKLLFELMLVYLIC